MRFESFPDGYLFSERPNRIPHAGTSVRPRTKCGRVRKLSDEVERWYSIGGEVNSALEWIKQNWYQSV
jgi:hypothetical protein